MPVFYEQFTTDDNEDPIEYLKRSKQYIYSNDWDFVDKPPQEWLLREIEEYKDFVDILQNHIKEYRELL